MTQPNLLELAKQGDATAIAALMNRHLQTKGITAKVSVINDCLMVIAESTDPPAPLFMVNFVRKGMIALKAEEIKRVVVWGQAYGMTVPAWRETFEISHGASADQFQPSESGSVRSPATEKFPNGQAQTKYIGFSKALNFLDNAKLGIAFMVCGIILVATVIYAGKEILLVKQDPSEGTSDQSRNSSTAPAAPEPENFLEIYFKNTVNKQNQANGYWCSEAKEIAKPLNATRGWQLLDVKKYGMASADVLVNINYLNKENLQDSQKWNIYIKKEADQDAANKLPGGWCIASMYQKD